MGEGGTGNRGGRVGYGGLVSVLRKGVVMGFRWFRVQM